MTLIIGCITKDFGVISGDTQLSSGLSTGIDLRRETQIKIHRPAANLVYGIMGKWNNYFTNKEEPGKISIDNYYDIMKREIWLKENKAEYINQFVTDKKNIDATVLIIEKDADNVFTIDEVSSLPERELTQLSLNNLNFRFNEPFSFVNSKYIEGLIVDFYNSNDLSNSLIDVLFLMNNIQLEVISKGCNFAIVNEEGNNQIIHANSVGGTVTLSIITNDDNSWNNLFAPYRNNKNILLDKTTYPFSKYVDDNKIIRYVDNLSMLVRNIHNPFNKNIADTLLALVIKQINFIVAKKIMDAERMNIIITCINKKFELKIPLLKTGTPVEPDNIEINLENIVFCDEQESVDLNYMLRFF